MNEIDFNINNRLLADNRLRIIETCEKYLNILLQKNNTLNLTSIKNYPDAWTRHILESLSILYFLEKDFNNSTQIIDIGSGAGLPGIPIAIAKSNTKITLLEATGKKCVFLKYIKKQLNLDNLNIVSLRAEEAGKNINYREKYDIALVRAVGSLSEILELAIPLLKINGRLLALKGPKFATEIEQAQNALNIFSAEIKSINKINFEDNYSTYILEIIKTKSTPKQYPRISGMPKKKPI